MSLRKPIYLLITEHPIINLNVHIIDPLIITCWQPEPMYVVVFGSLC